MLDDTLIVFTSDHGDMLGDHFMIQKGVPWKQSVGIPLAVRLPGAAPVGENTAPVEISDIAATVLDYAGLDAQQVLSRSWPAYNDIIPSRSLLPVLRGEQERVRDFCFSESDFIRGAYRRRFHYFNTILARRRRLPKQCVADHHHREQQVHQISRL